MNSVNYVETHRKTYDTRVKYLVRKGLLPDVYRKQIHRSLIWKWERESPDKYTGYELNNDIEELYELMKKFSADDKMQKVLRSYYRINKTLKDIIGEGKDYTKKIKENKFKVVDAISRAKKTIGIKRGIKLFGISRSTYKTWAMEAFFKCGQSLSKLCSNAYPQQLTAKEVHKMHRLLSDEKYLHWPIVSVAYFSMKNLIVKAHPNTWYKYVRLMELKRKKKKKFIKIYDEGLRAKAPNEKWHADITELKTSDGKIAYIYLVMDNFSRFITSWRISDHICGKLRLETFAETIELAGIKPVKRRKKKTNEAELIVDGGSENHNKVVNRFIDNYPVEKLTAMKDILKSNSMIESVNKLIKYDYLYPKQIQDIKQLTNYFRNFVIPDYNERRPHGSLHGLTPFEAYAGKQVNFKKIREKMIEAHYQRINYNQTHQCFGCPFGCKR
jgi:putative transposase